MLGRNNEIATYRRVAPRLTKHEHTNLVIVLFQPTHLFVDRVSWDVGDATGDNPHRFARVCIHCCDGSLECHVASSLKWLTATSVIGPAAKSPRWLSIWLYKKSVNALYIRSDITSCYACQFACEFAGDDFLVSRERIGIGAGLAARPLPHHRAYGSVHGGSDRLTGYVRNDGRPREPR
ncbi:hypothetical protein BSU04_16410 [Caballeronia sordidicola]|uniref:Uncharacterized protein n=1 Tax=Caballeronia sordidicola TaxID=196367 RepID=A0A226X3C9_CABSO|nr:hypothetical protein BSU04_16410 [Caballeronia sordidicola]